MARIIWDNYKVVHLFSKLLYCFFLCNLPVTLQQAIAKTAIFFDLHFWLCGWLSSPMYLSSFINLNPSYYWPHSKHNSGNISI